MAPPPSSLRTADFGYAIMALALLIGVVQLALDRDFFSDEAALAINLPGLTSIQSFFGPLPNAQSAPAGFLLVSSFFYQLLHSTGLSVSVISRLVPFVFFVAYLIAVRYVLRETLALPRDRILAYSFSALLPGVLTYSTMFKHYIAELAITALMLWSFFSGLRQSPIKCILWTTAVFLLTIPFSNTGVIPYAALCAATVLRLLTHKLSLYVWAVGAACAACSFVLFSLYYEFYIRPSVDFNLVVFNDAYMRGFSRDLQPFAEFLYLRSVRLAWEFIRGDLFLPVSVKWTGAVVLGVCAIGFIKLMRENVVLGCVISVMLVELVTLNWTHLYSLYSYRLILFMAMPIGVTLGLGVSAVIGLIASVPLKAAQGCAGGITVAAILGASAAGVGVSINGPLSDPVRAHVSTLLNRQPDPTCVYLNFDAMLIASVYSLQLPNMVASYNLLAVPPPSGDANLARVAESVARQSECYLLFTHVRPVNSPFGPMKAVLSYLEEKGEVSLIEGTKASGLYLFQNHI